MLLFTWQDTEPLTLLKMAWPTVCECAWMLVSPEQVAPCMVDSASEGICVNGWTLTCKSAFLPLLNSYISLSKIIILFILCALHYPPPFRSLLIFTWHSASGHTCRNPPSSEPQYSMFPFCFHTTMLNMSVCVFLCANISIHELTGMCWLVLLRTKSLQFILDRSLCSTKHLVA